MKEALKLALEALEIEEAQTHYPSQWLLKAITAIKAALEAKDEPVTYDKTELNSFVQGLYDKKMQEGKHGHFETMFHCVHQAIKRVSPPQRTWVGLTDEEIGDLSDFAYANDEEFVRQVEKHLKEKNNG